MLQYELTVEQLELLDNIQTEFSDNVSVAVISVIAEHLLGGWIINHYNEKLKESRVLTINVTVHDIALVYTLTHTPDFKGVFAIEYKG